MTGVTPVRLNYFRKESEGKLRAEKLFRRLGLLKAKTFMCIRGGIGDRLLS